MSLTIERISASALARLRDLARRQQRSEQEIAEEILESALQVGASRGDAAARIRGMTPPQASQTDSVQLLRQIRDE